METFTVGDMSMAAYGYLAGYPLLAVEKQGDGYFRCVFRSEDARAIQAAYRDPKTMVPLRSETKPGETRPLLTAP